MLFRSITYLGLLVVLLTCGVNAQKKGIPKASPKPLLADNEMSPEFKEQAWRAHDALKRIGGLPSSDKPERGFDQRKLEAEKAIDEAKYKSVTAKDKEILKLLQTADFFIGAASTKGILNPDWTILTDGSIQCGIELTAQFEPESLSEKGKQTASEKSCLDKQTALLKRWSERSQ